MKDRFRYIFISITIFLFYFFFSYIVDFIITIFNIDISSLKYIYRLIFVYAIEIIPALLLVFIYWKDLKKDFKVFKKNSKPWADKYIRYWIVGIILMSLSNMIISMITSSSIANNEEVVRKITDILPIYSILSCCITAPIAEELIYRKTIRNIFTNKKLAILFSGLLFGLAHVVGTYEVLTDLLYIIPYGILGSIFMYIYCDSDNIFSTISIHFLHNTIFLLTYFINNI